MIISDYFIIITINIFVLQRKEPFKKEKKKKDLFQGSNTLSTILTKVSFELWFTKGVKSNKIEPAWKGPSEA